MIDQIVEGAKGLWDSVTQRGGGSYSHTPQGPQPSDIPKSLASAPQSPPPPQPQVPQQGPQGTGMGGNYGVQQEVAKEAKEQAEIQRDLSEAEKSILNEYDIDERVVKGNLMDVYQRIGKMESNNRNDVSPSTSSAKGYFQYVDGSFKAAANRAARFYKNKLGKDVPAWVKQAQEGKIEITDLSRPKQEELLLIDWRMGPRSYMGDLKNYLIRGREASDNLHKIYENHHTGIDKDPNKDVIRKRMNAIL